MNILPKEKFNEFGTLLRWKDIIYKSKEIDGKTRGGFFLCIPNFEVDENIFNVKHGEYRKTISAGEEGNEEKRLEGKWGKIKVNTIWQEDENILNVQTKITSLQNNTYVRPGFHPYFFVGGDFQIIIGAKNISKNELPDDKLIILNGSTNEAELITNNKNIKIEVSTDNKDISFGHFPFLIIGEYVLPCQFHQC